MDPDMLFPAQGGVEILACADDFPGLDGDSKLFKGFTGGSSLDGLSRFDLSSGQFPNPPSNRRFIPSGGQNSDF